MPAHWYGCGEPLDVGRDSRTVAPIGLAIMLREGECAWLRYPVLY